MSTSFNEEILRLLEEARLLRQEIGAVRSMLAEVEEAIRLLDRIGWDRRFFRAMAGMLIEVPPEEARKYLLDRKEVLEARLKTLEEREKSVREKLRRALKAVPATPLR